MTQTDTLHAVFHSSWFDGEQNKIGRLEITLEGQKVLELAVITPLRI